MDSKKRFSRRVDFYVRYRPTYPRALLQHLQGVAELAADATIADVGSGTGLSTKLFLDAGYTVYGIEPNREMRDASVDFLSAYDHYEAVNGSAEATTLAAESVDLVVAGQAFHWFDPAAFRQEVQRILKSSRQAALFWNSRPFTATPFLQAYEQLLKDYAHNYAMVEHRKSKDETLAIFYGSAGYQEATFANDLVYDRQALIGRALSSSYTPLEDHPNHDLLMQGLHDTFDRYQENGTVTMPYQTNLYWGPIREV